MAIMRIALAAAALYYIAPHVAGDVMKQARPALNSVKSNDALTNAALEYCKHNTQACLKFAQSTFASGSYSMSASTPSTDKPKITIIPIPINAALRTTLPDSPPMPPIKPETAQHVKQK